MIALVVAMLGYVLYPHRMSLLYIATMNSGRIKPGCTPHVPKMTLLPVKQCHEIDPDSEPCVIRNAVSSAQIQQYLDETGDLKFNLKYIPSTGRMGNPLLEPKYFGTDQRRDCSINQLMARDAACSDHYTGFKSLNYTHYLSLNSSAVNLDEYSRTDIFVGSPTQPRVTASFHCNSFEQSTTLQLVGEKDWLMMRPVDFFGKLQAFALGAFNAAYSVCVNDLEDIPIQAVRTGPGDVLRFPKSWPHHIYTLPGPNLMINFRSFDIRPWFVKDVLSILSEVVSAVNTRGIKKIRTEFCSASDVSPTNYGQENPKPHFFQKVHKPYDMRCVDLFNPNIVNYKNYAIEHSIQSEEIDAKIYEQVASYLEQKRA